jgi:uncharacterized protein YecE (DUF72 family)
VHIGCSGWNYKSWRGRFYPADLPASRWLRYYTQRFNTVEVNNTFYRLPNPATFAAWREQTPPRFVMSVKASRFLTHLKRLRDPAQPIDRLFSAAASLGPRLGPVLYQLPPQMKVDLGRLETFLAALPRVWRRRRIRHVIEFRDPSWYSDATFNLLERHEVTLCLHDKLGSAIAEPFVGPFVYVRFHGTTGHYAGSYPDARLDAWAQRLVEQHRLGLEVFAYFNNDPDAVATLNAATLQHSVQRQLGPHPAGGATATGADSDSRPAARRRPSARSARYSRTAGA